VHLTGQISEVYVNAGKLEASQQPRLLGVSGRYDCRNGRRLSENHSTNRRVNWSWDNSDQHPRPWLLRWDEPFKRRLIRPLRPTVASATDSYLFSRQPRRSAAAWRGADRYGAALSHRGRSGARSVRRGLALTRKAPVPMPSRSGLATAVNRREPSRRRRRFLQSCKTMKEDLAP
jgi:hypothetical protein